MSYVIETKDLTKIYGRGKSKVIAVNKANLLVRKGAIHGIVGHNGAGKTTLISMLIGLTLPTSGTGKVLGYDIIKNSKDIRRHVGLLPEGFGFYGDLTARENLLYIAKLNGMKRDEAMKRIQEVIKIVGLENYIDAKVKAFSRGMKQRLGIAQALLKDPDILILDEPTIGLDPLATKEFRDLIRKLSSLGKTIVICTHLLRELGDLFTDLSIMIKGKIVAQGSLNEIRSKIAKGERIYEIELKKAIDKEYLVKLFKNIDNVIEVVVKGRVVDIHANKDIGSLILDSLVENKIPISRFQEKELSLEKIYEYYHKEVTI